MNTALQYIKRFALSTYYHNDVVIYVPKGTREAYREASRLFENVVEIDFSNKNLE